MTSIMVSGISSCSYFDTVDELRYGEAQEDYHTRTTEEPTTTTTEETHETIPTTTAPAYVRLVGGEANKFMYYNPPSVGTVKFPVFMVEFPDVPFTGNRMSPNEVRDMVFDEDLYYSLANMINKSSYGNMHIDGDLYTYTAANSIDYYKTNDRNFESLAMEVMTAFDDEVDFTEYDADENGVLDFFVINIAGEDPYYRGCTSVWWKNVDYRVDNELPGSFVVLDAQPYAVGGYQDYYVKELMHEMGHCLGLPDYYVKGTHYDTEGFTGDAGNEVMDEMEGDYSMFSKIMLGWANSNDVQVYSSRGGTEQVFRLYPTNEVGSCLIIPKTASVTDVYLSEYFLVEYYSGEGVRVFHVDSSTHTNAIYTSFENSNLYPDGDMRLITLVNDGEGYMNVGDVIDFSSNGFGWYGDDKTASVDSGYSIRLDGVNEECAVITVTINE